MQTNIVSGHPGIGKTTLSAYRPDLSTLDVEPFNYKWIDRDKEIINPDWPENCLQVIRESYGKVDVILISTYPELLDSLVSESYEVTLVYPDESQKDEYRRRYTERKNPTSFIELMMDNFEMFIARAKGFTACRHIVLKPEDKGQHAQYLSDVIDQIRTRN
jgi:adenylate kinase family enzyme